MLPQPDPLLPDEPDAERFDRIVAFLARNFRVLPLAEAARALTAGRLPSAAACITFDDGYADNLEVAAPILKRHGVSATFFIATAYIGGGRMWNDTVIEAVRAAPPGMLDWSSWGLGRYLLGDPASRVRAYGDALDRLKYLPIEERLARTIEIGRSAGLPDRSSLMMDPRQVVALRDLGMDIGGHTMSHPILTRIARERARDEIEGGRAQLREWLGDAPRTFAYPNGVPGRDYAAEHADLVRAAGFEAAVSTAPGAAGRTTDPFQIPRFTPWDRSVFRFGARSARNLLARR